MGHGVSSLSVMAQFLQRLQNGDAVFRGDVVVQLHIQAQTALGQIEGLHTFPHMVPQFLGGAEGEELTVQVQIDGDVTETFVND